MLYQIFFKYFSNSFIFTKINLKLIIDFCYNFFKLPGKILEILFILKCCLKLHKEL